MQLIQPPQIEENTPCPYLDGRDKRYEYFLAGKLTAEEVSGYLATGWRKFGLFYFRPACPECSSCTPLRVLTEDFVPSRSQRRVLKKGSELTVKFGPLKLTDRIYAIYENHTVERMGQSCDVEEFLLNFYVASCPALQSEVYLGDELVGVGFLDQGHNCLSSVYFCFDTRYAELNPGTFSILKEIEHARSLRLPHYYLGYSVSGCQSLAYNDNLCPRDHFDWHIKTWTPAQ